MIRYTKQVVPNCNKEKIHRKPSAMIVNASGYGFFKVSIDI